MNKIILTINAGSSSIKFSVYANTPNLNLIYHGICEVGAKISRIKVIDENNICNRDQTIESNCYSDLLMCIFKWLNELSEKYVLSMVSHRIVHGGKNFLKPTIITPSVIKQISALIPLAPLHQNYSLNAIEITTNLHPNIPQIACFDTSFHQTQDHLAKLFALPKELTDDNIIHYGFHGISYEYIASILHSKIGILNSERVIAAHLGSGASMCALHNGKSIATSMGFTALDGLMMGSRCGRLDPGVILYLLQEKNYSVDKLQHLLYYESGLLGVSGISKDLRELFKNNSLQASEAIELFCYRAALEFGSLYVALGGCNALVFSAGIGENMPQVRQKICDYLYCFGIELDKSLNKNNETVISSKNSKILVSVIPTNEEYILAKHAQYLIKLGYSKV
ncbi:MAG: ackA [Burkholderiales bacterium]|jgi:acetate kinase|nr:ackA [Burkholderiales bacterium]